MTANPPPNADAWEPWAPQQVAARLGGCQAVWGVAGGWAIDLWLGKRTRVHTDIEVAIARSALNEIRQLLPNHSLYAAKDGLLEPLVDAVSNDVRQVWVLDKVARKWRLDLLLDPGEENVWIYRRDARVHAPRPDVVARAADGIPYLRPEVVLLFKGKDPRPKDYTDLANCLGELDQSERKWLIAALLTAHPHSPWLDGLRRDSA